MARARPGRPLAKGGPPRRRRCRRLPEGPARARRRVPAGPQEARCTHLAAIHCEDGEQPASPARRRRARTLPTRSELGASKLRRPYAFAASYQRSCSASGSASKSAPEAAARRAASSTLARNRWAEARRASSGSAPRARATATAAKRTSPSSRAPGSSRSSAASSSSLREGRGGVGVVEAGGGGAPLGLRRAGQRREAGGEVVEDPLLGALGALAPLPEVHDAGRRLGRRVAVDVGVAADELVGLAARDGAPGRRRPPPPAAGRGRRPGRAGRRARRRRPSPPRATASATSNASSIVCGTIVSAVWTRSQGHSRRRRSPTSASARHLGADRAGPQGVAAGHGLGVRQRPGDAVRLGVGGRHRGVRRGGRSGRAARARRAGPPPARGRAGAPAPSARRRARPAPPPGRPRARPARGR